MHPASQTLIEYGDYFNQSGSLKFIFRYLLELKIIVDCPTSFNYLDNNASSQLHHIITISSQLHNSFHRNIQAHMHYVGLMKPA